MRREVIGRTLCKNGFVVSTVGFPGLNQRGGDYETAMWNRYSPIEVMEQCETPQQAIKAHNRYVRENDGRSWWDWFLP